MFVHVVHFCFVPIPPLRFAWQAGYVASCTRKEDGIDFEWLGFFPTFITGGGCFHDFMGRKFPVSRVRAAVGVGVAFVLSSSCECVTLSASNGWSAIVYGCTSMCA